MHVCHLITGLGIGGTPVMLAKLVEALHPRVRFTVIGMTGDEGCAPRLRAMGVPVHTLGMNRGRPHPKALWRLCSLLRSDRPDVLQTWLYHADLMGLLAAKAVAGCPVVWNVRHATLTPGLDSRSTLLAARASAKLSSRGPSAIVVNSQTGLDVHVAAGYAATRMRLIPNGFDLSRFRPDDDARSALRQSLGLAASTPLIGLMSRYSTLKGQPTFVDAMNRLHAASPDAHFVLCGTDITPANAPLQSLVQSTACADRFHLLGERRDIAEIQASLDIAVSASTSEAFSNSIGEALACGVPVVTTNVGDSASLVGDAGRVVDIGDARAMAAACLNILQRTPEDRKELSRRARRRMEEHYEIGVIARRYHELWMSVIKASGRRAA
ncbi:N,N'-diacetylbacillosaminyl-diphospho-undecaprenol alpha-1,3-N-acetylgalactosaminyltransferase [Caulifigura coniformis]|uniref:N, N'-diacetylbacillosaminyl-diphospho-undecaprenol alpha-1,3-N-acetylgalactosaminyltransferase n=1 Tax=Caulifigura coniformis TaxID=2527983 RepID=A0A517SK19_9PLAN|nr:glycosyltransferase [Caulifigura coniformis]QDT56475.1 N,N'-diacetylbacillosaminyl-diphospho-undecaprenol alpha-1,3-N-acetylgalactosaminyltransferase [Caulifigura coniformis]